MAAPLKPPTPPLATLSAQEQVSGQGRVTHLDRGADGIEAAAELPAARAAVAAVAARIGVAPRQALPSLALRAPVDNLLSNCAYMVMTALAWDLKAWWALRLPEQPGRWHEKHRAQKSWVLGLEFKTFVQAFVRLPCQIVRTARRLVYRLLGWNPHLPIFFRLVDRLRC
jgi:hypothetical protein